MTIEEYIIDYLDPLTTAGVSGSVPHPMPDNFITVEKTGESEFNYIPTAQIAIDCWSTSRAEAALLAETVEGYMANITTLPQISRCAVTASYNNTSLATNKPRYSLRFEVVYLF